MAETAVMLEAEAELFQNGDIGVEHFGKCSELPLQGSSNIYLGGVGGQDGMRDGGAGASESGV